jgi:signal transduction histidine kinase
MNKIQEKQEYLATVAHEIKAPLAAIINLLDVVGKGYVDPEKGTELVCRAKQKAEMVIRMLDDILDYTLLEDKSLMKRVTIDIYKIILESVSIMRPYMEAKRIQLSQSEESCAKQHVMGNYTFLLRVFNNIIMNAIKYNKEGGQIDIRCERLTPDSVTIHVEDTGIGIPEDEMEAVFQFFVRGKEARKNIDGSIGLGLSLVRKIIEDHNGSISLASKVNEGTRVSITLPLVDVEKD